jgi:hypothetical protein
MLFSREHPLTLEQLMHMFYAPNIITLYAMIQSIRDDPDGMLGFGFPFPLQ